MVIGFRISGMELLRWCYGELVEGGCQPSGPCRNLTWPVWWRTSFSVSLFKNVGCSLATIENSDPTKRNATPGRQACLIKWNDRFYLTVGQEEEMIIIIEPNGKTAASGGLFLPHRVLKAKRDCSSRGRDLLWFLWKKRFSPSGCGWFHIQSSNLTSVRTHCFVSTSRKHCKIQLKNIFLF